MARINQLKETESPASPRDVIAAILTEALPANNERRTSPSCTRPTSRSR